MAKIFRITVLALLCCGLYGCGSHAANDGSVVDISAESGKTQVIIIGTIHGAHHRNTKYTCEELKEIILSLKPDVILNELPLSQVDPNGRPIERLRDKQTCPECWATDTVATQLGIRQIAFDRPDRQQRFKETKFFERRERASETLKKWLEQLEKENSESFDLKINQLWEYAYQVKDDLRENASPNVVNSEAYDSAVRMVYLLWFDIVPNILKKYPGYETLIKHYNFERDEWQERNSIMANNIIKAAKEYPGKRLVVVTGCEHRYILRDLLKDEESIELKEYWQVNRNR